MTAWELWQKYLDFFTQKGHKVIPSAPLIPEEKVELSGTQRVLFTTAGMHPLVPYLLGESHPEGKRLVNVQKCLRTDDIDEVGDKVHHTFFEMLGNWSLGDYWKKEAIEWSFEFLTSKDWLGIDRGRLAISVFAGDGDAPFDSESYDVWHKLEIPETRIAKLPKKNNWWGPVGETGPCGPDTEMFIWAGNSAAPEKFDPDNPEWIEAWNDVFMEYEKTAEGKFEPLKQKNVDTGMGLERMLAVLNGTDDDYLTDLWHLPIQKLESLFRIVDLSTFKQEEYLYSLPSVIQDQNEKEKFAKQIINSKRIILDHIRAATFLLSEGVTPTNKDRGYVSRRLIRRAILHARNLAINGNFTTKIAVAFVDTYKEQYPDLEKKKKNICGELEIEETNFRQSLDRGLKKLERIIGTKEKIGGLIAFDLYQTDGFPLELTKEILRQKGQEFTEQDGEEFERVKKKHQELSRTASAGMFHGGLADQSEQVVKYHTATHLLHAALRQILGTHVEQKGSNITSERLRFDFSHSQKMTEEEIRKVEDLVNQKIKENLPVTMEETNYEEAIKSGALAFFKERYGGKVKMYSVGSPSVPSGHSGSLFSREICGGPHVDFTGKLREFKIRKEEASGKGVRRIYATLA